MSLRTLRCGRLIGDVLDKLPDGGGRVGLVLLVLVVDAFKASPADEVLGDNDGISLDDGCTGGGGGDDAVLLPPSAAIVFVVFCLPQDNI